MDLFNYGLEEEFFLDRCSNEGDWFRFNFIVYDIFKFCLKLCK